MMRHLVSLLALFPCAVAIAHAAEATPPPQHNAATLQLNAGPGQALSWRTAVNPRAPVLLSVSLDQLQPSEDWGPVLSVCLLQTLADQEEVCLRLAPDPDEEQDEDREIIAKVVAFPDGEMRELAHSYERAIHFDRDKPIQVRLELTAERVEFLVNDKLLHVYDSPVMHHGLSLACSSAVCTMLDIR